MATEMSGKQKYMWCVGAGEAGQVEPRARDEMSPLGLCAGSPGGTRTLRFWKHASSPLAPRQPAGRVYYLLFLFCGCRNRTQWGSVSLLKTHPRPRLSGTSCTASPAACLEPPSWTVQGLTIQRDTSGPMWGSSRAGHCPRPGRAKGVGIGA